MHYNECLRISQENFQYLNTGTSPWPGFPGKYIVSFFVFYSLARNIDLKAFLIQETV